MVVRKSLVSRKENAFQMSQLGGLSKEMDLMLALRIS